MNESSLAFGIVVVAFLVVVAAILFGIVSLAGGIHLPHLAAALGLVR